VSLPLIITPEAELDVAEAKAWYDRQRQGLGERFLLAVEEALERIRRIPNGATFTRHGASKRRRDGLEAATPPSY
jgi:hypothetical protein